MPHHLSKCVFVTVPFLPGDRAAIARAAHDKDMSTAQFIESVMIQWLNTEKRRTVVIPEIPVSDKPTQRKRKNVSVAENQTRFESI